MKALLLLSLMVVAALLSSSTAVADDSSSLSEEKFVPLNIVAVSLPFYGHFLPVKAIAEKLARRGHNVTLLNENVAWCKSPVPNMRCHQLPSTGTFPDSVFHEASLSETVGDTIVPIFEETIRYHTISLPQLLAVFKQFFLVPGHEVDLIVSDSSCFASWGVTAKYQIPNVMVFPLVLLLPVPPESWLPMMGSEHPRDLNFWQRWRTYVLSLLVNSVSSTIMGNPVNAARALEGIRPVRDRYELMGMHTLTFSPTIWGYDIPHPQWPGLQPAGILSPELEDEPLEADLAEFLASEMCSSRGVVYVNFGTLSKQTDRAVEEIFQAMATKLEMCVVWKLREPARLAAHQERLKGTSAEKRIYLSKRFATPIGIMGHPSTFVFVTHCGDTSLGEAVSSEVPLVGIPFFADQGDVCQRMSEAGLGIHAGHKHRFTAADLAQSIIRVAENRSAVEFNERISRLTLDQEATERELTAFKLEQSSVNSYLASILQAKAMATFYGGSTRAAETIERHFNAGMLVGDETHVFSPQRVWEESKMSIYAADLAVAGIGFFFFLFLVVLGRLGRLLTRK